MTAVVCLLAFAASAPVPKAPAKTHADKIVGTWKMVKSSNGAEKRYAVVAEFTTDGKLFLRRTFDNGRPVTTESAGVYKVDGDKLRYAFGEDAKLDAPSVDEIKSLTDAELVVVDEAGNREEFVRVKPDGK